MLDVWIFGGLTKIELLRYVLSIMVGRRRYSPKVRTFRSAMVRIETREPYAARADAYDPGATPVEPPRQARNPARGGAGTLHHDGGGRDRSPGTRWPGT